MMRRMALSAALLISAPLHAGAQAPLRLELGAGATVPVGDLASSYGVGTHARAALRVAPEALPFAVRADAELHRLPERFADGHSALLALGASALVDLISFGPSGSGGGLHAVLGVAYGSLDTSVGGADWDPRAGAGLGASIGVGGLTLVLEARFVHVFASPRGFRLVPIAVAVGL